MGLGALVFVEVALCLKRDAAGGARIRPLAGVAAQVLFQNTGFQAIPSTM